MTKSRLTWNLYDGIYFLANNQKTVVSSRSSGGKEEVEKVFLLQLCLNEMLWIGAFVVVYDDDDGHLNLSNWRLLSSTMYY